MIQPTEPSPWFPPNLHIKSIEKTSNSITITIGETQPEKGMMAAQALTYPAKFIRITTDIRNVAVQTEDGEILEDINRERY